jgi:hypothetical protein
MPFDNQGSTVQTNCTGMGQGDQLFNYMEQLTSWLHLKGQEIGVLGPTIE